MSIDFQQLPHAGIRTLSPYVPGKSADELAQETGLQSIIKLASNENPRGCSFMVSQALGRLTSQHLAVYPQAAIHPLREKLAQRHEVGEDRVLLTNGSDLLFSLVLTAFGLHTNRHLLTHDYAFSAYTVQAKALGIPVHTTPVGSDWQPDLDFMIKAANKDTGLIFMANPNNPTGAMVPMADIKYLLNHVPESTVVLIDEAYYEYVYPRHDPASLGLLAQFPNLIVSRTFSKAYGLAGLRLGYAIADPHIIDVLWRIQPPFSVNIMALEAAHAALDDEEFIEQTLSLNEQGLEQLKTSLLELNFEFLPSFGNFITFNCGSKASAIYQFLLRRGIIVRPLDAYQLPEFIRVTVGLPEQNLRFLKELANFLYQKDN